MPSPLRASRRAVLAGAGVVVLAGGLTGCDLPGPSGTTSSDAPPGTSADHPDDDLVSGAVADSEELLALTLAVAAAHPALGGTTEAWAECHRSHLQVLRVDSPGETPSATPAPSVSPPGVPTSPGRALRQLLSRERTHAATLAEAAATAESGALARLLASMSAGVQMHLAATEARP